MGECGDLITFWYCGRGGCGCGCRIASGGGGRGIGVGTQFGQRTGFCQSIFLLTDAFEYLEECGV